MTAKGRSPPRHLRRPLGLERMGGAVSIRVPFRRMAEGWDRIFFTSRSRRLAHVFRPFRSAEEAAAKYAAHRVPQATGNRDGHRIAAGRQQTQPLRPGGHDRPGDRGPGRIRSGSVRFRTTIECFPLKRHHRVRLFPGRYLPEAIPAGPARALRRNVGPSRKYEMPGIVDLARISRTNGAGHSPPVPRAADVAISR